MLAHVFIKIFSIKKFSIPITLGLLSILFLYIVYSPANCIHSSKSLDLNYLYRQAKKDYIIKSIKKSDKMINKFLRCKKYKCGVFYLQNSNDTMEKYDLDDGNYIFLNDLNFKDVDIDKINNIYIRDYNGEGAIYFFNGIHDKKSYFLKDKVIDYNDNYYYISIIMRHIDKSGNIFNKNPLNSFYKRVNDCGTILSFF